MTEPLARRTIRLEGVMHGDDLTATIGGHLAGLARGAEKAGRNDWRGADIRIRRAWNAAYLRDEIEITWEER